jgi:hypothetical protein
MLCLIKFSKSATPMLLSRQIWWQSVERCKSYSTLSIFKMVSAAILDFVIMLYLIKFSKMIYWSNITLRQNPRWRQHHLGNIQSAITFKSFDFHRLGQKNRVWSCCDCKTELVICTVLIFKWKRPYFTTTKYFCFFMNVTKSWIISLTTHGLNVCFLTLIM